MSEVKQRHCNECSAKIVEAYEDPNNPEALVYVCANGHHDYSEWSTR